MCYVQSFSPQPPTSRLQELGTCPWAWPCMPSGTQAPSQQGNYGQGTLSRRGDLPGAVPSGGLLRQDLQGFSGVGRPASPSLSSAPPRLGPEVQFHLTPFFWRLHLGLGASFDRRDLPLGPLALQTTPEEHGYFGSNCLGYAIPRCSVLHPNPSGF